LDRVKTVRSKHNFGAVPIRGALAKIVLGIRQPTSLAALVVLA
jgi:hypothetical protein